MFFELPLFVTVKIESDEHQVPSGSVSELNIPMFPVDGPTTARFDILFNSQQSSLCFYRYYICDIPITDNPNIPGMLYISHCDEAYGGYPYSEECEDYTILYDPSEDPIDFEEYAKNFKYGKKRGQGLKCTSFDNSYYSQDHFIQYGGQHVVNAILDSKKTARPVQSGADLIIIASHGVYADNVHNPPIPNPRQTYPTGMANHFAPSQSGSECPPNFLGLFTDSAVLSPIYTTIYNSAQSSLFDNDFEDNPWPFDDEGEVYGGDFWQKQSGTEPVTWVLFLGCGILTDDSRFGYTPLEEWHNYVEDNHADIICGYGEKGVGNPALVDFIGNEFSNIIEFNEPVYPNLYIGPPPYGYNSRPIRAWMEANCFALNACAYNNSLKKMMSPKDQKHCSSARAIVSDGMWIIDNISETDKPLYRIFRIFF